MIPNHASHSTNSKNVQKGTPKGSIFHLFRSTEPSMACPKLRGNFDLKWQVFHIRNWRAADLLSLQREVVAEGWNRPWSRIDHFDLNITDQDSWRSQSCELTIGFGPNKHMNLRFLDDAPGLLFPMPVAAGSLYLDLQCRYWGKGATI